MKFIEYDLDEDSNEFLEDTRKELNTDQKEEQVKTTNYTLIMRKKKQKNSFYKTRKSKFDETVNNGVNQKIIKLSMTTEELKNKKLMRNQRANELKRLKRANMSTQDNKFKNYSLRYKSPEEIQRDKDRSKVYCRPKLNRKDLTEAQLKSLRERDNRSQRLYQRKKKIKKLEKEKNNYSDENLEKYINQKYLIGSLKRNREEILSDINYKQDLSELKLVVEKRDSLKLLYAKNTCEKKNKYKSKDIKDELSYNI